MNLVKFNLGGQPIFLDDLRKIQENSILGVQLMLKGLLGNYDEGVLGITVPPNDDGSIPKFQAGQFYVYHAGEIYSVSIAASLVGIPFDMLHGVYKLHINSEKYYSDQRTMDNGSTAYCREENTGVLMPSDEGSSSDYTYSYTRNLVWRLKQRMDPYL